MLFVGVPEHQAPPCRSNAPARLDAHHGMTGNEIRRRFLEFFASRDHLVLPSASLIPERDPTTLLISAGMQPLKPYFQGVSKPPAPRLASSQKSFRTGDIAEVRDYKYMPFFE